MCLLCIALVLSSAIRAADEGALSTWAVLLLAIAEAMELECEPDGEGTSCMGLRFECVVATVTIVCVKMTALLLMWKYGNVSPTGRSRWSDSCQVL